MEVCRGRMKVHNAIQVVLVVVDMTKIARDFGRQEKVQIYQGLINRNREI